MIVHGDIYEGEDKQLAEKSFLGIMSSLEKAKSGSRSFFLVSSSIVFDRTINREYTEGSKPNGLTPSALFLIEAEKKVMEYPMGYVYRKQDLFGDVRSLIDSLLCFKGEPIFCNESLRLMSQEVYNDLLGYAVTQSFGQHRLIHLAIPTKYPIHEMWFYLRGGKFSISETNPNFTFRKNFGFMSSDVLKTFGFYKKLLVRNNKEVIDSLKKIAVIDKGLLENERETSP